MIGIEKIINNQCKSVSKNIGFFSVFSVTSVAKIFILPCKHMAHECFIINLPTSWYVI